ncbi:MAG: protein-L-isoaspartate O-methyltransferase [Candidatus Niyogibacteria bacterium CG10_big_fil_rev_8_21_14_0_10_42_19]|uniref:Protein-L-isoaspartate O-methyltransferase n=1 Tax=Candidatus Niyogibacteria bacterium CG10_big_fil_rev_8_21_14_0_10_42_19 TaxID=1974725 RepID=A0A2H0TFN8_9BACT|nr:MAG: protein-L-isoaspartate O-methyltransferase [Candidatus Niyogibacteria bacterium CG10_big_fil_rev_8_21_14_0_10_42_19]
MKDLVKSLTDAGVLKTPSLINAFLAIDRKDFVPQILRGAAYNDEALPIGEGQTISQPYTVAFMLELLDPQKGDIIMDVGSGSGWQSSILACVVSEGGAKGVVYAVELQPAISRFGQENVSKYDLLKKGTVRWFTQSASDKLPESVVFDKIIAAAFINCKDKDIINCIPESWSKKLKDGGIIVAPIDSSVWKFTKKGDKFDREEYPGFVFVPYL